MNIQNVDLFGLTSFYLLMFKAWRMLNITRNLMDGRVLWLREEPLLHNPVVVSEILKSSSLRNTLKNAGVTKFGHLITTEGWMYAEMLSSKLVRSVRLTQRLLHNF